MPLLLPTNSARHRSYRNIIAEGERRSGEFGLRSTRSHQETSLVKCATCTIARLLTVGRSITWYGRGDITVFVYGGWAPRFRTSVRRPKIELRGNKSATTNSMSNQSAGLGIQRSCRKKKEERSHSDDFGLRNPPPPPPSIQKIMSQKQHASNVACFCSFFSESLRKRLTS